MRLLVFGGRYYSDAGAMNATLCILDAEERIEVIIHGACPVGKGGADELAGLWAKIAWREELRFPINHAIDGPWPGAGPSRNRRMLAASHPDLGLEFPGREGTKNMRGLLNAARIPVLQHYDILRRR